MRFVFALIAACAFMLALTNGTVAAAAATDEPTRAEMVMHHEGDGDQVPDCPFSNGMHHHHSVSGEHQLAVPDTGPTISYHHAGQTQLALTRDLLPPGLNPASEPHPPKA